MNPTISCLRLALALLMGRCGSSRIPPIILGRGPARLPSSSKPSVGTPLLYAQQIPESKPRITRPSDSLFFLPHYMHYSPVRTLRAVLPPPHRSPQHPPRPFRPVSGPGYIPVQVVETNPSSLPLTRLLTLAIACCALALSPLGDSNRSHPVPTAPSPYTAGALSHTLGPFG